MLQETKLSRKNLLKLDDYEIFEHVRKNKKGGGIMIGVKKDIQATPVDVSPTDEEIEIIVVEIQFNKDVTVRFLTGYGPQEDECEEKINKFYCALEEEIVKCEDSNCGLVIEMDCNAKLGKNINNGDPHDISTNGKILWDIVNRRSCTVVNTTEKCKGAITRSRMKKGVREESVLDYIIVNTLMVPLIEEMEIDESKIKALTRFKKNKPVPSDHNYLGCVFNIPLQRRMAHRQEVYRLRNKSDLLIFKEKTTHTKKFSQCFTKGGDVKKEGKKWLKTLHNTIHSCFKKVRISGKRKKDKIQDYIDLRRKIKCDINKAQTVGENTN